MTMTGEMQTRIHVKDGDVTFESIQDCTPMLERCVALHNEGLHGSSEFRHAASLPNVLVERYCNDHNIEFSEFIGNKAHVRAMLNDPSLSGFRVWKGRV